MDVVILPAVGECRGGRSLALNLLTSVGQHCAETCALLESVHSPSEFSQSRPRFRGLPSAHRRRLLEPSCRNFSRLDLSCRVLAPKHLFSRCIGACTSESVPWFFLVLINRTLVTRERNSLRDISDLHVCPSSWDRHAACPTRRSEHVETFLRHCQMRIHAAIWFSRVSWRALTVSSPLEGRQSPPPQPITTRALSRPAHQSQLLLENTNRPRRLPALQE